MASSWLTWAGLGIRADERRACKRAGIAAADFAVLAPLDVVAATEEVIDEHRADHLVRRAGLLEIVTPAWADGFEGKGVRSRQDLAARSADELFLLWQDDPYTRPDMYRILATKIHAAGGPLAKPVADAELVRRAWVHRYGEDTPGARGRRRLRIPSLKLNAPVWEAGERAVPPPPPLDHRGVSVATRDDDRLRLVVVGHWQWAGHFAAFLRLDALEPGDEVLLTEGKRTQPFAVVDVRRGVAPLPLPDAPLTLLTPPHRRWAPWCREWGVPDLDPERTPVQVVVTAAP